jgi:hypothetical protein
MKIYLSLVIGSVDDIRTTVSPVLEVIRQDLVEFYNETVADGGLPDDALPVSTDCSMDVVTGAIESGIGRSVVIQESWLIR